MIHCKRKLVIQKPKWVSLEEYGCSRYEINAKGQIRNDRTLRLVKPYNENNYSLYNDRKKKISINAIIVCKEIFEQEC